MLQVTVPVIVLSETRSMFKNTLPVQATAAEGDFESTRSKVFEVLRDSATVDQMRSMMLALTTFSETTYEDFEIPEDVSAYAQAQFIAVR